MFHAAKAGDVPLGRTEGRAHLFPGTLENESLSRLIQVFAWRGKTFDLDGTMLSNRVSALDLPAIRAKVYRGSSWLDREDCIVLDYSRTSFVASAVRDEIREIAPGLHLGLIWLFGRRAGWFTLRALEGTRSDGPGGTA
ncbi:hypothetical protein [Actinomycetospora aeridis]|uniref:Uncharacterized protein n=1 Tax=Actinomycetospora aeridis TaxID=3129231 RepID=A0ABU8N9X3_9PSEU